MSDPNMEAREIAALIRKIARHVEATDWAARRWLCSCAQQVHDLGEQAGRALEQERDELVRLRGIANLLADVQTLPGQPLAVQSAIGAARAWKALASSPGAAARKLGATQADTDEP